MRTARESRNSAPESPVLRHIESVMLAADAHTNERHITLTRPVRRSLPPGKTRRVAPTGAPNAAASQRPPRSALTRRRRVACDAKSTRTRRGFRAIAKRAPLSLSIAPYRHRSNPARSRGARRAFRPRVRNQRSLGKIDVVVVFRVFRVVVVVVVIREKVARLAVPQPPVGHAKTTHDATAAPTCTMAPFRPDRQGRPHRARHSL